MTKTLSAIYENGLLRPLEPLSLNEHQRVSVTVSDVAIDPVDKWLDHEYMTMVDSMDEPVPSLSEVRQILSKIPGDLSDTIRAERDARG